MALLIQLQLVTYIVPVKDQILLDKFILDKTSNVLLLGLLIEICDWDLEMITIYLMFYI